MIRLVLVALAVALTVWLLLRIFRDARTAGFDWRGVGLAAGLVALAYLRQVTEIGGLV